MRASSWLSLPLLELLLLTAVGGCGGSSSETPFPQSAHEVAAIPVLQRSPPAKPQPTGLSSSPPLPSVVDPPGGQGLDEP
ncbi:MAG: hypothetical protein RMJ98_06160 [Myxococcales bacterium]|nr:hypothetical protein [Polyangiaceae bacterium]MDW8248872.1 hypothetical protein [Myxococcales bacterium]